MASLAGGRPRGRPPADVSSFVQLGVESLSDRELRRLGKGYTAAQVRTLVRALDERGIAHDAYLILSGPGTTLDDLVTTLLDAARLKIEHPHTFFVRMPVVAFVVPTFPSPIYRRCLRSGEGEIETRGTLSIEGYPELDYPLAARGLPSDPEVRAACDDWQRIVVPDPLYVAPLENLEAFLRRRLPGLGDPGRASRARIAIRRLSGAARRIVYSGLGEARHNRLPPRVANRYWDAAARLGPAEEIAREARNAIEVGDPRLVVIPTRDCSLRCTYCPMDKQEGMHMSLATLARSIELLVSSERDDLILQFFGGEALLRRDFVLDGMDLALSVAREAGKHVGFILSTNGVSLDEALLERLASLPVKIEVSIDGPAEVHNRHRRPRGGDFDSYETATRCARALVASGIPHEVIMVVTPSTVGDLCRSFSHVASLGFRRIQINHALALPWSRRHKERFARELHAIETAFYADGVDGAPAELLNLRSFTEPMLLNCEITVDFDGTVHFGNGFLVRTATPGAFRAGHVDDLECLDTYAARRPDNDLLISATYPPDIARNNLEVARIYASFIGHMRERFPELRTEPLRSPGAGHPR
jgi:MoaA/NifB/PqqE/SkfB family radical SAM enzyme